MNNSIPCNTKLLNTAICFNTKPIQSLLHIVAAKKSLPYYKNTDAEKALEDHIAILENNFLTTPCDAAEKKLLHIMLDLKNYISHHQHDYTNALDMHIKLSQTYALITQLVTQCNPSTKNAIMKTKKYNEALLIKEGYSYQALAECADRIIQHLYTH